MATTQVKYCKHHPGTPVTSFCHHCSTLMCSTCRISQYTSYPHQCEDIQQAEKTLRQKLKEDWNRVWMCISQLEDELAFIAADETEFAGDLEEAENEINERYKRLKNDAKGHRDEMLNKIAELREERAAAILKRRQEVAAHKASFDSFKEAYGRIAPAGSKTQVSCPASDIIAAAVPLRLEAVKIVAKQDKHNEEPLNRVLLTFKPTIDTVENHIGSIDYAEFKGASSYYTKSVNVLKVFKFGGSVQGVAVLGKELFVLLSEAAVIKVYDTTDFKEKVDHYLSTFTLNDPTDLIACPRDNCLYVSERETDEVLRFDVTTGSKELLRLQKGDSWYRLSLSRENNIVLAIENSCFIQELVYNRAALSRVQPKGPKIFLDASIDRPVQALQLSDDHYVVCHQGESQHRVCVVDRDGTIIQSYGSKPGSAEGFLNKPSCLTADKYDFVFVADKKNNRVLLLSPTLTFVGDIQLGGNLNIKEPITVHLDQVNRRLYIGEGKSGGRLFVITSDILVPRKKPETVRSMAERGMKVDDGDDHSSVEDINANKNKSKQPVMMNGGTESAPQVGRKLIEPKELNSDRKNSEQDDTKAKSRIKSAEDIIVTPDVKGSNTKPKDVAPDRHTGEEVSRPRKPRAESESVVNKPTSSDVTRPEAGDKKDRRRSDHVARKKHPINGEVKVRNGVDLVGSALLINYGATMSSKVSTV